MVGNMMAFYFLCFSIMIKTLFFHLGFIFFLPFTEIACDYSCDCIGLVYVHA
jgi:hypothetical protein